MKARPRPTPFHKTLRDLMVQLDKPTARRSGPGRPAKVHAATVPVILHLYKDHVRWLDDYAAFLETLAPGNARLSRVEIVRALLLALAEHTVGHALELPADVPIQTERDLQKAVVAALGGGGGGGTPTP